MFRIIFFFILAVVFISNEQCYSQEILRTDIEGKILSGDKSDWDYDGKNYNYFLKYKNFFMRPFVWNEIHLNEYVPPFFADVEIDNAEISWFFPAEDFKFLKYFSIERKNIFEDKWIQVGSVSADETIGENDRNEVLYKFTDRRIEDGGYDYRLRVEYTEKKYFNEYFCILNRVFIKSYDKFQFYPVYPNPAADGDTVNFSFYLPNKESVNMYFVDGIDTNFILKDYIQDMGYYKLAMFKISFPYKNEVKRLYIDCKSCDKRRNYGDVEFK